LHPVYFLEKHDVVIRWISKKEQIHICRVNSMSLRYIVVFFLLLPEE